MRRPAFLSPDPEAPFPPAETALRQPDGLLAIGGDLSPQRLLNAYRHGIFPWYSEGQPILWWAPDPRMVFRTEGVRLSSRFRRGLRHSTWQVRADTAFAEVMAACAGTPRPGQDGTWITDAMQAAYLELHRLGHAHSVEVFDQDRLGGRPLWRGDRPDVLRRKHVQRRIGWLQDRPCGPGPSPACDGAGH